MSAHNRDISIEQAIVRDPLMIDASATIADAIALMSLGSKTCDLLCEVDSAQSLQLAHAQNSCILVVTESKRLIGILTERDLIKFCGQIENFEQNLNQNYIGSAGQNLSETAIAEVMTYPVYSLLEWEFTDIFVAINRFQRYKIRHLPLVNDHGAVMGLVTHESLRQLLRPIDMLRLLAVSDVMVKDVICAQAIDSVAQIANLMSEHQVSSVVIVEPQEHGSLPLGILTESDIVQYLALELNLANTQAQMVMSSPPIAIDINENLWSVRELMQERMVNHILVTDEDGKMTGIITQSSILKTLQPVEVYKLVSNLESRILQLEKEKLELLEIRNQLLDGKVEKQVEKQVEGQIQESNKALLDSNDIFRQFAENSYGVILIREISFSRLLYVSPAYEKLWGKSCDSLYQNPDSWMDSLHPEDRDRIVQVYQSKAKIGFFSEEYRIVHPSGMIRWILGRCFPIKNSNGETYRIAAIAEDITERKNTEIALKESEQRLKASESLLSGMFDRSVVGMAITDIDGRFVRTNPFYQQMVGYSESELASMLFSDNTLAEDLEENLRLRHLVLSGEAESYQMEKRLVHRDGSVIWVRTTSSKILDEDETNKPPFFIGVIENISDRKQAEESLQSLVEGTAAHTGQDFLPKLAEYIAKSLEVRHVFVTKRVDNHLELIVSWVDGELKPASMISIINVPCALTIQEGRFFCFANLQEQFTGNEIIKNLEADSYLGIAIINSNGESIGSLCIFDDKPIAKVQRADAMLRVFAARVSAEIERQEAIAELYQLNQQLETRVAERTQELQLTNQQLRLEMAERQKLINLVENSNAELVRATKLKDEFLANMSHELRTPLNAILGMSEGLLSSVFGDLNERQRRSLSLIENSGRHLLELINDILDVAKIGAGKLNLEIHPVSIENLCKSSLSFVKQMASQKNIQLRLSIQPDLGAIAIDERRIRQALINLLSNAVKFTEKSGEVSLEVKLIQAESIDLPDNLSTILEFPDTLVLAVTDTGIGIASEDLGKLFQTFVQIDSSLSRQYAGTGLGLTLVKQIAELHGGKVHVTSRVGKGSCFSILLPHKIQKPLHNLAKNSNSNICIVDEIDNFNQEPNSSINPLILLAEDNPTNVETFADYLSSRGYRLIFAANGQEAVEMAVSRKPDLVLMDIQMPVLDGLGAIQKIRANPNLNSIPIVALTALATNSDREKCLRAGADEYLAKPVKLAQLTAIIKQQLKRY